MRGQRSTRAEYGVKGEWLCVSPKWKWSNGDAVETFTLDDGEKLHIIVVYCSERDAVFTAMNSTWSHSKHLGARLLVEAAFMGPKLKIWHHGLLRPHVVQKQVKGIEEEHAERLPKTKAPWAPTKFEPLEPGTKSKLLEYRL
jgi:hypothetical protein